MVGEVVEEHPCNVGLFVGDSPSHCEQAPSRPQDLILSLLVKVAQFLVGAYREGCKSGCIIFCLPMEDM